MEGEYFVFDYYDSNSRPNSCLIPLWVERGRLKNVGSWSAFDPQELSVSERTEKCLEMLRERGVNRVWSCGGDTMYDKLLGLVTHFSGGVGKYAFHYDRVQSRKLGEIWVREFFPDTNLNDEERERQRQELIVGLC